MGGSSFVLQWPSDSGKITAPYDTTTGVVRISAAAGATVKAAAAGKVTAVAADRIEVASDSYLLVYGNLSNVSATAGQSVNVGDALGTSAGPDISLAVRQTVDPTPFLPAVPATPTPSPAPTPGAPAGKLYVSPNQNSVRVR